MFCWSVFCVNFTCPTYSCYTVIPTCTCDLYLALIYNWRKGERENEVMYIYTETMPYIFMSYNGRLYFSEVTRVDENYYYCQVSLTSLDGRSVGSTQAPTRVSRKIRLNVLAQGEYIATSSDYRISNQFSFHTMYYETSCVFYIPEPLARGYKAHNEFHNTSYEMKIHLRFFLSHELIWNEQITTWNRLFSANWNGWRRGCHYALGTSPHGAAYITVQRRALFIVVENQKHQEERVLI